MVGRHVVVPPLPNNIVHELVHTSSSHSFTCFVTSRAGEWDRVPVENDWGTGSFNETNYVVVANTVSLSSVLRRWLKPRIVRINMTAAKPKSAQPAITAIEPIVQNA